MGFVGARFIAPASVTVLMGAMRGKDKEHSFWWKVARRQGRLEKRASLVGSDRWANVW
jgi:hypothetical protein